MTCEVLAVQENGLEVKISDSDFTTFIKRSDLSRERFRAAPRALQRRRQGRRGDHQHRQGLAPHLVSIKALEIAEEKHAVQQYGSSDSGASLGDIFKAAIKKKEGEDN